MGKRRLITSLSAVDVQLLASKILDYVSEAVRLEHANAHNWHHVGNPAFFDGHRQFIGKLESWLIAQAFPQFVPLPKWDPATPIPGPFQAVKVLPAVASAGFGSRIANPTPNLPMPPNLRNVAQFPTVEALTADNQLQNWHGNVHVTVGGAMLDVNVSPCAAVFWLWHAFIDDIYEDWLTLPPRWESIGGVLTSDPAATLNLPGGLVVFARGTDNAIWHTWQNHINGDWSHWESLGGDWTSGPGAALYRDGRLNVFARGTDNAIWTRWQTTPNGHWLR
jgi:hypothetical protein